MFSTFWQHPVTKIWFLGILLLNGPATAQDPEELGFQRIPGKHVDIITDLPLDDEMRSLPIVFEKAMPVWCRAFGVEPSEVEDWHSESFIMLDRKRFSQAGLIPAEVPEFPYGFQYKNQMWVVEQESEYYRRHLFLHEGTHWFMNRYYGSSGPPWLMEGMAEWLGTHQWDPKTQTLEMGIIPESREQVPLWGRVKRIQDQLKSGQAPSLESILLYGPTAHRSVDAYAWSWAAVVFLQHHPDTQDAFQDLLRQPMRSDNSFARALHNELRQRWPAIRGQWQASASDFDYGYEPLVGMLQLSPNPQPLSTSLGSNSITLRLPSNSTWQSTGVRVQKGQKIRIEARGRFSLRQIPKPWASEADGITLEYYRGHPLGKLLVRIVDSPTRETSGTQLVTTIAAGADHEWIAENDGELAVQINEPIKELADNSGELNLTISRR